MIFIGNVPVPDSPPLPLELHPGSVIRNRMMEVRLRRDSVSRRHRRWGRRLRRVATGNCGLGQADRADQRLSEWVHQNFCQPKSLAIVCYETCSRCACLQWCCAAALTFQQGPVFQQPFRAQTPVQIQPGRHIFNSLHPKALRQVHRICRSRYCVDIYRTAARPVCVNKMIANLVARSFRLVKRRHCFL